MPDSRSYPDGALEGAINSVINAAADAAAFARGLGGGLWAAAHPPRWRDRAALEAWQAARVQAHLAWVLPRSRFYRERLSGRPLSAWRTLAPIDKAAMMAHFDDLNTVGVRRDDALAVAQASYASRDFRPMLGHVTVGLSSGTSGTAGIFLADPWERGRWAGTVLARCLAGIGWGPLRIGLALRANSQLYESLSLGPIRFRYFDLLKPATEMAAAIAAFAPTVLVGPPSVLTDLLDAGLDLARVRPRRVIAAAEVLDAHVAARLAGAFGGPIHQIYQATEGFLGASCRHGTLHLNEDLVLVEREALDGGSDAAPDGRFVPVLTDLVRRSQPLVRYRLNDVLVPRRTPCPCGSPFLALERVEGRQDDVWRLPAAEGGAGRTVALYPDQVTHALVLALEAAPAARGVVTDFTAEQVRPDAVTLRLAAEPASAPAARDRAAAAALAALAALARARGAVAPTVHVTWGLPLRSDRKHRRVTRGPGA